MKNTVQFKKLPEGKVKFLYGTKGKPGLPGFENTPYLLSHLTSIC